MRLNVGIIGFGEAGQTFAGGAGGFDAASVFDIKTDRPETRNDTFTDYERCKVNGCNTLAEALLEANVVLSLVSADQALDAAKAAAPLLKPNALFLDMNSVAPQTKLQAAERVDQAGGRYIDVAIMSPVQPAALNAPLLISGPQGAAAEACLQAMGFDNLRIVGDAVGRASSIKMLRSVIVKGMEALTAECLFAAEQAGVTKDVLQSLGDDWFARANYNLERMMSHGLRRAAEMEEVVKTLNSLGVSSAMTKGTVAHQRAIGQLAIRPAPAGLQAKLDAIQNRTGVKPA